VPQRFTTTRKPTKSQSLNWIELSEHHILNAPSYNGRYTCMNASSVRQSSSVWWPTP
jgi:hypothetical protein